MNTSSINPDKSRPLRTSDFAAVGAPRTERDELPDDTHDPMPSQASPGPAPQARGVEQLDALFDTEAAARYRARWTEVQSSFVDDPRRAVADGDELVAQVMQSLAESFAHERQRLESELSHTEEASTEALRVGLRRYRSFFERLLAL
jgi:hypothetical protein